jgi:hypothetical protein
MLVILHVIFPKQLFFLKLLLGRERNENKTVEITSFAEGTKLDYYTKV